MAFNTKSVLF